MRVINQKRPSVEVACGVVFRVRGNQCEQQPHTLKKLQLMLSLRVIICFKNYRKTQSPTEPKETPPIGNPASHRKKKNRIDSILDNLTDQLALD